MPRIKLPLRLVPNHGLPVLHAAVQFPGKGFASAIFLVDSGTQNTLLSHATWSKIRRMPAMAREPKKILGIGGYAHFRKANGAQLVIRGGKSSFVFDCGPVFLNDDEKLKLSCIGSDWLKKWNAVVHVDYGTPTLSFIELDQATITLPASLGSNPGPTAA